MKKSTLIVGIFVPKSNFGLKLYPKINYSVFYNNGKKILENSLII